MGKEELEKVNTDNSFKEFHCEGKRREKQLEREVKSEVVFILRWNKLKRIYLLRELFLYKEKHAALGYGKNFWNNVHE